MRSPRNIMLGILVLLIAAVVSWMALSGVKRLPEGAGLPVASFPVTPLPVASEPTSPTPTPLPAVAERDPAARNARTRGTPPPALADFWEWSPERQLTVVTDLQGTPDLQPATRDFLLSALQSRELDETTRNNIANGLTNQNPQDPRLAGILVAMVRDPSESYQWREYALQHVAVVARTSPHRSICLQLLWEQFRAGECGIPGTAALHLHRLDTDGVIALDREYIEALVRIMLREEADLLVRMTSIGICNERQAAAALPAIRLIARHPLPSLRRVAVAALGALGDEVDQTLISEALGDGDPTVSSAATAALEAYTLRTAPSTGATP